MSGAVLLDETHDPRARSWLDSANRESGDFPIQNLPFAVFRRAGSAEEFRGGVAIGDQIIDLAVLAARGIFQGQAAQGIRAGADSSLNSLMQLGPEVSGAVRHALFEGLLAGSHHQAALQSCLVPQSSAQYSLPAQIGDYTDFYASIYHATAVGRLMRPDKPLLPNYEWIPIGYHGRSSSIDVSGQTFHRPRGQRLPPGALQPVVGASTRLDYELELGVFVGRGNSAGMAIPIADAEAHIFGMCLLNDWSARDLQTWEYQPLGPFLAKNFATTISPWIVTLQALAPFRVPPVRPENSPPLLPYLSSPMDREAGALDIRLEALLQSEAMRARQQPPHRLSLTSFRHAYWTIAQLISHHSMNGCNLRPGDLLGTGTQSGPTPEEAGSLLELSIGGSRPIQFDGETRTFLEDGDSVILRAWCESPHAARIGFGEAQGRILPAVG
ncbi:MAG TPA: fumarylacetoacetase [Steroidobacteraceae bacterium]|nr:fumarylacetoacetase [Steroidobacteraceae bacterium]